MIDPLIALAFLIVIVGLIWASDSDDHWFHP